MYYPTQLFTRDYPLSYGIGVGRLGPFQCLSRSLNIANYSSPTVRQTKRVFVKLWARENNRMKTMLKYDMSSNWKVYANKCVCHLTPMTFSSTPGGSMPWETAMDALLLLVLFVHVRPPQPYWRGCLTTPRKVRWLPVSHFNSDTYILINKIAEMRQPVWRAMTSTHSKSAMICIESGVFTVDLSNGLWRDWPTGHRPRANPNHSSVAKPQMCSFSSFIYFSPLNDLTRRWLLTTLQNSELLFNTYVLRAVLGLLSFI